MKQRYKRTLVTSKGQSIVEVLISLAIVVVLAVSLVTTLLITQKAARTAKNDTQAAKLAQDYIEKARIVRDRKGFDVFKNADGTLKTGNCYVLVTTDTNPDNWNISPSTCPEQTTLDDTIFARNLILDTDEPTAPIKDKIRVKVLVTWVDTGNNAKSVSSTTFFSDCVATSTICN